MLVVKQTILNKKTGELEDTFFYETRQRKPKNKDFKFMQDGCFKLLMRDGIKPSDVLVMLALIDHCRWANVSECPRKELMAYCRISEVKACTSLKALADAGLILRDPDNPNKFEIDPWLCWKGSPSQLTDAMRRYYGRLGGRPLASGADTQPPAGTL